MKVCLVRPEFPEGGRCEYPPFGLLRLAAYGNRLDDYVLSDLAAGDGLCLDADKYYMSLMSCQFQSARWRLVRLRAWNSGVKVFVGGPAVKFDLERCRSVLGRWVDHFATGDCDSFDGYRVADWSLIGERKYKAGFAVESSRGCPFRCRFCTAFMGGAFRVRDVGEVVGEVKYVRDVYGARKFYFTDDCVTADIGRFRRLLYGLSKLGVELSVPEGIQAKDLDEHTLVLMKEAGLRDFVVGAESGCQRVLDEVVGKVGLSVEQIESVVVSAVEIGLRPSCFFVVGMFGESREEAERTVRFAAELRRLGARSCSVRAWLPMRGTPMCEEARLAGWKRPSWVDGLVAESRLDDSRCSLRWRDLVLHPRASLRLVAHAS